MPLGIERINARRKQPNDRITFIKPLEGPDKALAEDFLERIAAICNPIMKQHHLSIMSLEEYEPNLEFVGRNFNAGEVIQLVLKAPYTANWLPFKYVQMVMMHELAHCRQMNHSGAFWKVRNIYAGELKTLWARGYTGEGMWSRGITLVSGQYERDSLDAGEVLPEHLCGGTYRSSTKRKRKPKEKINYKEREARRIAKKFGKNGMALGADEETKAKLESGKRTIAKPRVAGSARGRELRAAAALARFETKKAGSKEGEDDLGSETESGDEDNETAIEAIDINGQKLLDRSGRGMVKVCEDEDKSDVNAQDEMSELRSFDITRWAKPSIPSRTPSAKTLTPAPIPTPAPKPIKRKISDNPPPPTNTTPHPHSQNPSASPSTCPICSMDNLPTASTCAMCAHVLDPSRVPSVWRCRSETCRGGEYINAGDAGVCGVCGGRREGGLICWCVNPNLV